MCSVVLYINIHLVQERSTGRHTGGPRESREREALQHGRHVHVVPGEERLSLFLYAEAGDSYFSNMLYIILITARLFCPPVLEEVFDFLHQAELEESSVAALQKKYGL